MLSVYTEIIFKQKYSISGLSDTSTTFDKAKYDADNILQNLHEINWQYYTYSMIKD